MKNGVKEGKFTISKINSGGKDKTQGTYE